jgi:hypothetical protein
MSNTDQDELSRDADPQTKGGLARAAALTREERKEIAQQAALARWHSDIPKATHEGVVRIGEMELWCAVDSDGRRLVSESALLRALGMKPSGTSFKVSNVGADQPARLPMFVGLVNLRPFIDSELMNLLTQPVLYRSTKGGRPARGLGAVLIPKICEVWLHARDAGVLRANQLATAARADALIRGLARTGIIALIDEATGYQEIRDRHALQAILDAYLSRELAAWAKRFPNEFYQEIFRLRGWKWGLVNTKRIQGPRVVGKYTNDFVYSRLAPGILEELQKRNPPNERGRRLAKHHQWLTEDVGHPALAQHVHAITGLMRASESWEHFQVMVNRAFPRRTDLSDLPLFCQKEAREPDQAKPQQDSQREVA